MEFVHNPLEHPVLETSQCVAVGKTEKNKKW